MSMSRVRIPVGAVSKLILLQVFRVSIWQSTIPVSNQGISEHPDQNQFIIVCLPSESHQESNNAPSHPALMVQIFLGHRGCQLTWEFIRMCRYSNCSPTKLPPLFQDKVTSIASLIDSNVTLKKYEFQQIYFTGLIRFTHFVLLVCIVPESKSSFLL